MLYHIIRQKFDLRYPRIRGLSINLEEFEQQLKFFIKNNNLVNIRDVVHLLYFDKKLPKNSVLLTFDDGYREHFSDIFPILFENNVQGAFFVNIKALNTNNVLLPNKIQFILEYEKNREKIIKDLFDNLDYFREEYKLKSNYYYYNKFAKKNWIDDENTTFIRFLLQRELPKIISENITSDLFKKYVCLNEKKFSEELYLNFNQIKCMKNNGMYIGAHGYNHYWMDTLDYNSQLDEIIKSQEFLKDLGNEFLIYSYPHGGYNKITINLLEKNCWNIGLTANYGMISKKTHPFKLPRYESFDRIIDCSITNTN